MGVEHRAPRGMGAIERENVCGVVSGVEEGCGPCGRAVLICGQGHTIEEGNSAPKDERVMSKIQQREDNYITEQRSRTDMMGVEGSNNAESIVDIQNSMMMILEKIEINLIEDSNDSIDKRFMATQIKSARHRLDDIPRHVKTSAACTRSRKFDLH